MTVGGSTVSIESTLEASVPKAGEQGFGDSLTIRQPVEYTGIVSDAGSVSVEASPSHSLKWKGSGAFGGSTFNGHLENGVIWNGLLSGALCSYDFELKKTQPLVRASGGPPAYFDYEFHSSSMAWVKLRNQ